MCLDLFGAGTDTTSTALSWSILFLIRHVSVQDKCYSEICEVVGTERLPCIQDRPKMTYVEATIMECLRLGNVTPLGIHHTPSKDVIFRGYLIPHGVFIVPNLSSVLSDGSTWKDPDVFRPERFIGQDGKLRKRQELIPFGIGNNFAFVYVHIMIEIKKLTFYDYEERDIPTFNIW